VLADDGGVIVMDAGANAMVRRAANGELSTMLAFTNNTTVPGPDCPAAGTRDFVPTAITVGPDGAYYFGHLNGLQVLQGSSKVYRMERGGTPEVFRENFTWIVALAFDPSGNLYVLQFTDGPLQASGGSVTRVAPDGTREKLVGGLQRATGMTVGPDGAVYISMTQGQNYRADGEVRRYVIP
jgi:sugar lactone lactonase YvrE